MAEHEWRRRVLPDRVGKAQEAVAQLRARGIRVELEGGNWLVFDLEVAEFERAASHGGADALVAEILDRVWPGWRECVTD